MVTKLSISTKAPSMSLLLRDTEFIHMHCFSKIGLFHFLPSSPEAWVARIETADNTRYWDTFRTLRERAEYATLTYGSVN